MTVRASEDEGWVEEPTEPVEPAGAPSRRPALAGALGSAWALLVGVALVAVTVMLAWAVSPNPAGDSAAAWRAVGAAWLAAHQVPLAVSGQAITLLPIGGLLLGLLLTRRSGRWAARLLPEPSAGEVTWVVLGAAAAYGAGGAGVAWVSGGGSIVADPWWAAAITATVAAVGTLWGVARQAGLVAVWRSRTRASVWSSLTAALAAVLGLLAAGATLVTLGLVTGFSEVAGTLADLDPGPVGAAGVTLLGLLSLPTLDVWAMSVVVGPGFDLGGLGGLSAFGGEVESLPALPVLAAIPATVPAWAPALLVVPVGLGVLAGRIRWGRDLPTPVGALLSGVAIAGVVAVLVGGLVVLASGSLGDDRLAVLGPPLLPVMGSAAGLVLLGFLAEAVYQSVRLTWDLHRAERRAAALGAESAEGVAEDGSGDDEAPTPGPGETEDSALPVEEGSGRDRRAAAGRGAAAVAGRVAGAGGAVTSGIAGAGASAVSVVSGAGSAVTALVAGAAGALSRSSDPESPGDPTRADAERLADPAGTDRDGASGDHEVPEGASDRDGAPAPPADRETATEPGAVDTDAQGDPEDPSAAVAQDADVADDGTEGPADPDPTGAASGELSDQGAAGGAQGADVVDLRPSDAGEPIDLRGATEDSPDDADGDDPSWATAPGPAQGPAGAHARLEAEQPVEDHTEAPVASGEVTAPPTVADATDARGAANEPAHPGPDPAEAAPGSPGGRTWAGADDDTDEIPITRRVPAGDAAQA